jgi:hypothetical protein
METQSFHASVSSTTELASCNSHYLRFFGTPGVGQEGHMNSTYPENLKGRHNEESRGGYAVDVRHVCP